MVGFWLGLLPLESRESMKNMYCSIATAGFMSVACSLCSLGLAQDNAAMQVDVSRCVQMDNAEQRYRCFDEITSHLRNKSRQSPVAASTEVQQEKTRAPAQQVQPGVAVREFGLDNSAAEIASNEEGDAELRDTIADLEEREPGRWLVTLDSGQVWYQDTTGKIRLQKGMKVRIYPSNFGSSYRLAADEINGFIQVRRIK